MLHTLCHLYQEITSLDKVRSTNKPTVNQPQYITTTKYTLDNMKKVPSDLHDTQLWTHKVWNWDEVSFDSNGRWEVIVLNYKWWNVSRYWCSQTGEHVHFWCSLLILSQVYGQWYMTTITIHQSETLTEDSDCGLPGDWIFQANTSGYMDRDGWLNNICHFRTSSR